MSQFYHFVFRADCLIKTVAELQPVDFFVKVEQDFQLLDGIYSLRPGAVQPLLAVPDCISLEIDVSECAVNLLGLRGKHRLRVVNGQVSLLDFTGDLELNLQKSRASLIRPGGSCNAFLQESELAQTEGNFSICSIRAFSSLIRLEFPQGAEGKTDISGHDSEIILRAVDKEDLNVCAADGFSFFGGNCRYFINVEGAQQKVSFADDNIAAPSIKLFTETEIQAKSEELCNLFDRFEADVEAEHKRMEELLSAPPEEKKKTGSEKPIKKIDSPAAQNKTERKASDSFLYERFRKGDISLEELEKLLGSDG
jgi:hypothetical protein